MSDDSDTDRRAKALQRRWGKPVRSRGDTDTPISVDELRRRAAEAIGISGVDPLSILSVLGAGVKPCHCCHGAGEISIIKSMSIAGRPVGDIMEAAGDHELSRLQVICPKCHGEGEVEVAENNQVTALKEAAGYLYAKQQSVTIDDSVKQPGRPRVHLFGRPMSPEAEEQAVIQEREILEHDPQPGDEPERQRAATQSEIDAFRAKMFSRQRPDVPDS